MAKSRTIFYCTECGNETPKWAGKCPACGAWNTVVEQEAAPKTKSGRSAGTMRGGFHTVKAVSITEVDAQEEIRFSTGMGELDRVLGGGAVKGSLVLVGGAPGVGEVYPVTADLRQSLPVQPGAVRVRGGIGAAAEAPLPAAGGGQRELTGALGDGTGGYPASRSGGGAGYPHHRFHPDHV